MFYFAGETLTLQGSPLQPSSNSYPDKDLFNQKRLGNRVAGRNPDLSGCLPGQKELRGGPCPHAVQRRNAGRLQGEIPSRFLLPHSLLHSDSD